LTAEPLELLGILIACVGAAAAIVLPDRRLRMIAIAVALVAAPLLVLGDVWDEPRVVDLRESPAQVAAGLILGAALVAALVVAFRRWPQAFAITALAVLPLRVPIEIGGETANLLVPLYLVIAAAFIAHATAPHPPARGPEARWIEILRWLLAATLVLYAIQSAYSEDVANAIENVGFFLTPFAVMFVLLLEVQWTRALLGKVLIAVAAVAAAAALIGIGQFLVRDLFLNPELFDANQLHKYFRVNSVFFDPNIFGRYLGLAITALGAYLAWSEDRRWLAGALAVSALCLVGLTLTYSITSFAALLAGLGVVALLRWSWRGAAAAAALGAVALVALVVAGGTPTSDIQTDRNIDSGHFPLVEGGLILAGAIDAPTPGDTTEDQIRCKCDPGEPLFGWGSGSFGAAFYENIEPARTTISHSEPITVAAEQGVIGFALYLGLLAAAAAVLAGGAVQRAPGRTAVAACFVTILVHSFGYTGFLIDPATWAILALGIALRGVPGVGEQGESAVSTPAPAPA
jgi:putative inorganic carbon (HCO3(-)) transporter